MEVAGKVLALFLFMVAGVLARKIKLIGEHGVHDMTQIVLCVTLPCSIVMTMQSMLEGGDSALLPDMLITLALSVGFMLAGLGIGRLCFSRQNPDRRAVLDQLAMFSNCGFMGFPVVLAALGERALVLCVMPVVAFHLLAWTIGVRLFSGRSSLSKALCNPALISLALAGALLLLGIRLPDALGGALKALGDMTTPLSMIVIGARITGFHARDLKDGALLAGAALRLVVLPALAYAVLLAVGLLGGEPARVVVLTLGMPAAAMIVMQAEQYGTPGSVAYAARVVAVTTALSLVTIPLLVLLIAR